MSNKNGYSTKEDIVKAIVVFVNNGVHENNTENIVELTGLCEAAGMEVVGFLTQNLAEINSSYLIGKGKLDELKKLVDENEADIVVFDNELNGSKIKNLENYLDVQIATRSMVILDIFASRAETLEGKKQTELAQLKYMMPRLVGSYIGGGKYKSGVGMRGPGETKLELDKRNIKDKIAKLEREINDIDRARDTTSKKREEGSQKLCSLVGYTNAGKSTIMNMLAKTELLSKDMLFATLDTVSRNVWLGDDVNIVLSDTVGFINKLPHEFIVAFRSTLKAATKAKLLLVVVDTASKLARKELDIVIDVLKGIGAGDIKKIILLNKIDKPFNEQTAKDIEKDFAVTVRISAKTGEGFEKLKELIKKNI